MITAAAKTLYRMVQFAQVRDNPPAPIARRGSANEPRNGVALYGNGASPHFHELSYAAGYVSLKTTDWRHTVVSRFRVVGDAEPWCTAVRAWRFNLIVPYLTGSLNIEPVAGGWLHLWKEHVDMIGKAPKAFRGVGRHPALPHPFRQQFSLRTHANGLSFPVSGDEAVTATSPEIAPEPLRAALRAMTGGKEAVDERNDRQIGSLFTTGEAMGASRRIEWSARGPAMCPFDINLRKETSRRVEAWLRLLTQGPDGENAASDPGVLVEQIVDVQGRISFRFLTTDRAHMLVVPGARRAFHRRSIDDRYGAPTAIVGQVERNALLAYARLIEETSRQPHPIRCRFYRAGEESWELEFCDPAESQPIMITLPLSQVVAAEGADVSTPCTIQARSLRLALEQVDAEKVFLAWRPAVRTMSVSSHRDGATLVDHPIEAFFTAALQPTTRSESPEETSTADGKMTAPGAVVR